VQGSRLLNDNGSVIGLNVGDLIGALGVLVMAAELLRPLGLDVAAVPLAVLSLVALVPVRLKYRRKIVRDYALSLLQPKVIHDPQTFASALARRARR
jgi:hypothetical protein